VPLSANPRTAETAPEQAARNAAGVAAVSLVDLLSQLATHLPPGALAQLQRLCDTGSAAAPAPCSAATAPVAPVINVFIQTLNVMAPGTAGGVTDCGTPTAPSAPAASVARSDVHTSATSAPAPTPTRTPPDPAADADRVGVEATPGHSTTRTLSLVPRIAPADVQNAKSVVGMIDAAFCAVFGQPPAPVCPSVPALPVASPSVASVAASASTSRRGMGRVSSSRNLPPADTASPGGGTQHSRGIAA